MINNRLGLTTLDAKRIAKEKKEYDEEFQKEVAIFVAKEVDRLAGKKPRKQKYSEFVLNWFTKPRIKSSFLDVLKDN